MSVLSLSSYLVASIRQSVEQTDETAPRKVPHAERTTRMEELRTSLRGVSISGELEPAHVLLDRACSIFDLNSVKFLDPASCVSRAAEVLGTSKNKELILESGSLVLKEPDKLVASTDSEIKVYYAFVRRALALTFARVMSFEQHGLWEAFLFESLHRDPPQGTRGLP